MVGLTVGLAVGGAVLIGALGYALQRTVDTEAFKTADAVARLAGAQALPDPLPVAGGDVRVQVVDDRNRIRAASIDADRLVPMLNPTELSRVRDRGGLFLSGQRVGMNGPVRVVAVPAGPADDPQTVLVAKSMADVKHSVHMVRTILLISFPLLVAALATVAWRVVGATLRPVEALRTGAEEITGSARGGRLPVPDSRDEIHRLAVTLNGMLDRLESARTRQRAFVADAAHELRSPLANMRTQLEVAQRLGTRTDWSAVAEDLLVDTVRLSRLVDDLLLLARADDAGSGHRAASGLVELGELLVAVADRYPSPPVGVVPPSHPLWTVGERDALARVVANLLDNAVRHARGEVTLHATDAVRGDSTYHVVTVTDDGPGIPAEDRERVFDRFTRLDDARARDAGGSGLGLAIVRDLVRRQGGTVELSDAHPGLRVQVRLPAHPAPSDLGRSVSSDLGRSTASDLGRSVSSDLGRSTASGTSRSTVTGPAPGTGEPGQLLGEAGQSVGEPAARLVQTDSDRATTSTE
ncbi:signal transduction histidine kinase [Micromonospora polyrhachis]|uniref:histidine kinase n=1 Tax=Micromonospora polyrhachis TaxID=1282883 RepID=A0A7W7SLD1_9ACTN|nr:signal transduction histidine kinase [Micromonospora polyrhachis]